MLARPPSEILAELLEESQEEDINVTRDANTRVCVMEGGDVLWLPAMQWHATLNLADDTVAVGGQVTSLAMYSVIDGKLPRQTTGV